MSELNDELNEALRDTVALDRVRDAVKYIANAEAVLSIARTHAVTVASTLYFDMKLDTLQFQRAQLIKLLQDWGWDG